MMKSFASLVAGVLISVNIAFGSKCSWSKQVGNDTYYADLATLAGQEISWQFWTDDNGIKYWATVSFCGNYLSCDGNSAMMMINSSVDSCIAYSTENTPLKTDLSLNELIFEDLFPTIVTPNYLNCSNYYDNNLMLQWKTEYNKNNNGISLCSGSYIADNENCLTNIEMCIETKYSNWDTIDELMNGGDNDTTYLGNNENNEFDCRVMAWNEEHYNGYMFGPFDNNITQTDGSSSDSDNEYIIDDGTNYAISSIMIIPGSSNVNCTLILNNDNNYMYSSTNGKMITQSSVINISLTDYYFFNDNSNFKNTYLLVNSMIVIATENSNNGGGGGSSSNDSSDDSNDDDNDTSKHLIAIIAVLACGLAFCLFFFIYYFACRRSKKGFGANDFEEYAPLQEDMQL